MKKRDERYTQQQLQAWQGNDEILNLRMMQNI